MAINSLKTQIFIPTKVFLEFNLITIQEQLEDQ